MRASITRCTSFAYVATSDWNCLPHSLHLELLSLSPLHRNRNRKLLISRAPTKAKSQEPAYSQALNQNKIDRQRSRSRESGRQTVRRLWWMVFGVETGR